MDMNVDTACFNSLSEKLRISKGELADSVSNVKHAFSRADQDMEGEYYTYLKDSTDRTGEMINTLSSNLDEMKSYLDRLKGHVERYLSCKYDG